MVLPDDYADPPERIWLKWLKWISITGVLVGVWMIYFFDVWHPAFWLEPEIRNDTAVFTVYETLVTFVLTNGRWPKDEKDFRENIKYSGGRQGGVFYRWPDDATRLLRITGVKYGVPLAEVAQASPLKFEYVYEKKTGPNPRWHTMSERLIGACNSRIEGEQLEKAILPNFDKPKSDTPESDKTVTPENKASADQKAPVKKEPAQKEPEPPKK
ncbi:MAG: hypothetical protein U0903_21215 [Planctomycetales bacterium]